MVDFLIAMFDYQRVYGKHRWTVGGLVSFAVIQWVDLLQHGSKRKAVMGLVRWTLHLHTPSWSEEVWKAERGGTWDKEPMQSDNVLPLLFCITPIVTPIMKYPGISLQHKVKETYTLLDILDQVHTEDIHTWGLSFQDTPAWCHHTEVGESLGFKKESCLNGSCLLLLNILTFVWPLLITFCNSHSIVCPLLLSLSHNMLKFIPRLSCYLSVVVGICSWL